MILSTLQASIVTWLKAAPALATVASGVISDDGTYPKLAAREPALREVGCCITVLLPESNGLVASNRAGLMSHSIGITIIAEARPAVPEGSGETWIPSPLSAEALVEAIYGALLGHPDSSTSPRLNLIPDSPPWEQWGRIGGENRVAVNLVCQDTLGAA